ncbi:protein-arginine deiminase family protein [Actinophytocola sp. NPDC049390]|uniref:protein-arginine deiminase family protein n=1 Tax=Actinophytocola sp. NPDC049390 TaxID=3363894 RepID=UPI0037A5E4CC
MGLVFVPAASATAVAVRGDDVVLPNLDDDSGRCHVTPEQMDSVGPAVDAELAACHDAADDVVNGRADAKDLARLTARASTSGRITVEGRARVFVRRGDWVPATELTARELRRGVELGVEATDVRRPDWDGRVTVTLTAGDRTVSHRLTVAPLMLQHDLQRATTVFAAKPGAGQGRPDGWQWLDGAWEPHDWESFSADLEKAGAPMRYLTGTDLWWQDNWWQDFFEPAYATANGRTMRFAIRSANTWDVGVRTPRPASRAVFRDLRGPDVAVVQAMADDGRDAVKDLRNATGNIESLPPYRGYPDGRLVYGSDPRSVLTPDPAFIGLLTSQNTQPPVVIDTSWLLVGHADETTHVVKARNARGWTIMVADPRLALSTLRNAQAAGHGDARFTGARLTATIDEVLADERLLADNEEAARHIDDQISVLAAETGLTDLVRVPVLFTKPREIGLFVAATPGIPNGLSIDAHTFAAPDPHAPVVDGEDIFQSVTERALRGVDVHWVEDQGWAHLGGGEVHCTTNAWREVG